MKFCPYCGAKQEQAAAFCGSCGKELLQNNVPSKEDVNQSDNKQPINKRGKRALTIAVVAIAAVAAISYGAWLTFSEDATEGFVASETEEVVESDAAEHLVNQELEESDSETEMPHQFESILQVWENATKPDSWQDDFALNDDISHIDFSHIYPEFLIGDGDLYVYYVLEDLSGNGSPELLVSISSRSGPGDVLAVYSYANGEARYIFERYEDEGFWSRNTLIISNGGYFHTRGSGGWNSWASSLYRLNNRGGVDLIASIGVQPGIFDSAISVWENFLTGEILGDVGEDALGVIVYATEYEQVFGNHMDDISRTFEWHRFATSD